MHLLSELLQFHLKRLKLLCSYSGSRSLSLSQNALEVLLGELQLIEGRKARSTHDTKSEISCRWQQARCIVHSPSELAGVVLQC